MVEGPEWAVAVAGGDNQNNLTPAKADSLVGQYFVNRIEQEKMLETYYKKVKTATNANVAFQFYQAELYLTAQIRAQIMMQIPT
ncbi:MAG: hypothetical protein WAZ98_05275 [Cyclobacteriaceae bacterium]